MRSMEQIGRLLRNTPGDGGKTLLELVGQQRLVVERHRGIAGYTGEEVLIKASYGLVCVAGTELRLCCMSREQLCIRGNITQIKLIGRDGDGPVE